MIMGKLIFLSIVIKYLSSCSKIAMHLLTGYCIMI